MKIRTNLKHYFLIASIFIGILITSTVFLLTVKFYHNGFFSTAKVMLDDTAESLPRIDEKCIVLADIYACKEREYFPEPFASEMDEWPQAMGDFVTDVAPHERFETPDTFYFVYKTANEWGQEFYIAKVFYKESTGAGFFGFQIEMYWGALFVGILVALLIMLILIIVLNKMVLPIEKLRLWALDLVNNNTDIKSPDHRYSELNEVSLLLSESIEQQRVSVEQEREFLQHTSHELRTPIAACRSNLDLLSKVIGPNAGKPNEVIGRIDQAIKTMTDLTNTFLWLSRSDIDKIRNEPTNLGLIISESIEELSYLIERKDIELEIDINMQEIILPKPSCKIIVLNMVRNAFQHTFQGKVYIYQNDHSVKVINTDEKGFELDDLGFGLGLKLIRRIVDLYGWDLNVKKFKNTYSIEIKFLTVDLLLDEGIK
jgi:signal transduction histidine kinase